MAAYEKLSAEETALQGDIKVAEEAIDYHTVENRTKRKGLQGRRDQIAAQMKAIGANIQSGQRTVQQLLQGAETSLALATHAEAWSWKEVETNLQGPKDPAA